MNKKTLLAVIVALSVFIGIPAAIAVTVVPGSQGGTGISTSTASQVGWVLTVVSSSPLRYVLAPSSGGGGGGSSTASTTILGLHPNSNSFIFLSTSTPGISTTSPNIINVGPDRIYYLASNPNQFITATSSAFYAQGFITATSTVFYPFSSNPGAYVTATSTAFYPFSNNPGSYITGTSTAFVTPDGLYLPGFVTATSTVFYPLASNPGAYVTGTSTVFLWRANNLNDVASSSAAGNQLLNNGSWFNVGSTTAATTTLQVSSNGGSIFAGTNVASTVFLNFNNRSMVGYNDTLGDAFLSGMNASNSKGLDLVVGTGPLSPTTYNNSYAIHIVGATRAISIGTSTPATMFEIIQNTVNAASSTDLFEVASTTGASFFRVRANGNVGVGTTTPSETFTVIGTGSFSSSVSSTNAVHTSVTSTLALSLPFVTGTQCLHAVAGVVLGSGSDCALSGAYTTTTVNGLSGAVTATSSTTGSDFNIGTSGQNIVFNLPTSSATTSGKLSSVDWSTFNSKQATISAGSNIVITGASVAVTTTPTFASVTSTLATHTVVTSTTICFSGDICRTTWPTGGTTVASPASFWNYASTSFAFSPGAGSSTITVSDPSNAYKFDKQYGRGTVFRWTEAGTVKLAVVATSTYATNVVTLSLIGDFVMASSTPTSTLQFGQTKMTSINMAYAGTLSTSTDVMGHAYIAQDMHIFGVDASVGTKGTGLSSTFQLYNSSTTNLFAADPAIGTGTTTIGQRASDQTVVSAGSFLSANIKSIPNSPPVDLYVTVLAYPENYKYLP